MLATDRLVLLVALGAFAQPAAAQAPAAGQRRPAQKESPVVGQLPASAQPSAVALRASAAIVRGLYNWVHTTGDAEKSFPFYRDVLGIELARSPFAGAAPPNAPPEEIRPASQARSDPLVANLTNTHGARFRTAFTRAPNTPFGLELSEFFDIQRAVRPANPWDPGASTLIFEVRDLDAVAARAKSRGAPIVTLGAAPLETPAGRSLLVRDPDGYLVQAVQAAPAEIAATSSGGEIVRTSIGLTVANTSAALRFYRDLLGFEVRETRRATNAELNLNGLAAGELRQTAITIPGTAVTVLLSEFALPPTAPTPAEPFQWRIQDVGAPQLQLRVTGLDTLLDRTSRAGYRILSVGARPIERPFGRFVFVVDPDGVLVELVEPAAAD
jgi:catechol 2,3-dioxygenase-like lactoylglutathione lyase family enzyme